LARRHVRRAGEAGISTRKIEARVRVFSGFRMQHLAMLWPDPLYGNLIAAQGESSVTERILIPFASSSPDSPNKCFRGWRRLSTWRPIPQDVVQLMRNRFERKAPPLPFWTGRVERFAGNVRAGVGTPGVDQWRGTGGSEESSLWRFCFWPARAARYSSGIVYATVAAPGDGRCGRAACR